MRPFLVAGPSARLLLGPVDLIGLVVVGFQPVEIALDSLSQFASYGHAVETGRSERLGLRAGSAAGQQTMRLRAKRRGAQVFFSWQYRFRQLVRISGYSVLNRRISSFSSFR